MLEIINRTGWRGEVKNVIHVFIDEDVLRDILLDETVILVAREVLDVLRISGDEIVDSDDAESLREKPIGQMRTEKSRAAGDDCCSFGSHCGECCKASRAAWPEFP